MVVPCLVPSCLSIQFKNVLHILLCCILTAFLRDVLIIRWRGEEKEEREVIGVATVVVA